jgi:quercetin dioxygenase-like cupin family protein
MIPVSPGPSSSLPDAVQAPTIQDGRIRLVKVFTFDRAEREVTGDGSAGLHATRIAQFAETARATCLTVAPGGVIGTHPAGSHQVLLIVAGSGWVAGSNQARVPVTTGDAAYWPPGEVHTTGTDTGLTAIALEGGPVTIFQPEIG